MAKDETTAHGGLYAAMSAAQAEMGRALKDTNNPHFKSKYADLASVCDACMPALSKHGIAVLQPCFDDETGRYVKTIFVHGQSGETAECRVPLIVQKNDMQGYGSAVTYARRYGLMGMAGIAPEDDDGNAAAKSAPTRQDAQSDFDADVAKALRDIAREKTLESLGAFWGDLAKTSKAVAADHRVIKAKDERKAALQFEPNDLNDEIPY